MGQLRRCSWGRYVAASPKPHSIADSELKRDLCSQAGLLGCLAENLPLDMVSCLVQSQLNENKSVKNGTWKKITQKEGMSLR